ncbi:alpha/beta fold hydrolase [Pelobacter seleniigenes]|uniref:alpha/beta fold hydrolase n=1 Tax=Pelobacter seleniigenes TaxID=407188 RepID=UPI00068EC903|nr:alpha/beta hydrolase [Pelobacter seleniigenes]
MTEIKKGKIQLSGGQLSYREAGSGETLFLMHGMNGSSASWERQMQFFCADFRTVAWDCPGYGDSDVVGGDVDDYVKALIETADQLGINRMILLGHSMGGVIAARVACRAPQLVAKLIISSSFPGRAMPVNTPLPERYTKRVEDMESLSRDEYASKRAMAMLPEGTNPEVFEKIKAIASRMRKDGLLAVADMVVHTDNRPILNQITCPTLVITASKDKVVPYELATDFLEQIPNVHHVSLEGVGHAAYLEDPQRYNELLSEFLADAFLPVS